jgi:hypothetical protein
MIDKQFLLIFYSTVLVIKHHYNKLVNCLLHDAIYEFLYINSTGKQKMCLQTLSLSFGCAFIMV